jgi:Family of unknown function (DUF6159)
VANGTRSFQLLKASWAVLRSSKGLTVFPVLSGLANIVVAASFLTPAMAVSWDQVTGDSGTLKPVSYVLFGLFYLVTAYVTIFFNAALISQANVALSGGRPTVANGLKAAGANWLRILPWALLSATVSLILRMVEERLGFIGRFIIGLFGIAWNTVTFLVLPTMVVEEAGVGKALKRSSEMFKRTWGENVIGGMGLGLLTFAALIPAVLLIILGASAGHATLLVCVALAMAWLLVVMIFASAMSGVFQTALYRFAAAEGQSTSFGDLDMSQAFRPRR